MFLHAFHAYLFVRMLIHTCFLDLTDIPPAEGNARPIWSPCSLCYDLFMIPGDSFFSSIPPFASLHASFLSTVCRDIGFPSFIIPVLGLDFFSSFILLLLPSYCQLFRFVQSSYPHHTSCHPRHISSYPRCPSLLSIFTFIFCIVTGTVKYGCTSAVFVQGSYRAQEKKWQNDLNSVTCLYISTIIHLNVSGYTVVEDLVCDELQE